MHESSLIVELLIVVAAAAAGGALFERLRLPAIAGFLVAGAVVGPHGLALIRDPGEVHRLAELGVAFLLFQIGLELPLKELRRNLRVAVITGALQVTLTIAVVAGFGFIQGLSIETAIVLGMIVSMSSTAVVMRTLRDRGEVDAPHGRLTLGVLLFQDLCVLPFLFIVSFLAKDAPANSPSLLTEIIQALIGLLALLAAARYALPWILERVVRLRSSELFSVVTFLLAIGSAVVAEEVGLTMAAGAFIAGLGLRASPYGHQLFAEVAPWRGVLLGVFFTAVGMLLDVQNAFALRVDIAFYLGSVVVLKAGIVTAVLILILRQHMGPAVRAGLGLAQTGEFSFVVATVAASAGLLDEHLEQVFVAGSILTLAATPFLIRAAPRVVSWLSGVARKAGSQPEPELAVAGLSDHVVIVGFGLAGRTLARVLKAAEIPYRIVDINPHTAAVMRSVGEPIEFGDASRSVVLRRLGVPRAKVVVIATSDPAATRSTAAITRTIAPNAHIVARTRYLADVDELMQIGASQVIAEELESTIDLFSEVLHRYDVPTPAIGNFAEGMRADGYGLLRAAVDVPIDPWLAELLGEAAAEWVDVPSNATEAVSIASLSVRNQTGVSILAVRRGSVTIPNPSAQFRITAGDSLLALGSPDGLLQLKELLEGLT